MLRAIMKLRSSCLALAVAACGGHSNPETPADASPDTSTDAAAPAKACESWHQWGNSAAHDGTSCVAGQPLTAKLADVVYDPFLAQELADRQDVLFIHYQVPLLDRDHLYMVTKKGTYTACHVVNDTPSCADPDEAYRLNSQLWAEQHFTIRGDGSLKLEWTFETDWKPEPSLTFEPVFQPALSGSLLVVPGAGGAIWKVDAATGEVKDHVQPFGTTLDPDTYVSGGIAVAPDGTIYYNAIKLDHDLMFNADSQAWLVAVPPTGAPHMVEYATLIPNAPLAGDPCSRSYIVSDETPLPWPPVDGNGAIIPAPTAPCGPQRPGINNTPAIGADGTIFITSRAHYNSRYSYVAAVTPQLTPKWATSLRDALHDGCGVLSVSDASDTSSDIIKRSHCRVGTPDGLERTTGLLPTGNIEDASSASPVALPDGGVLYGSLGNNFARGHMFKLSATGAILGNFDFGWDSTPAVFGGPTDYKIVIKDNHYGNGPFNITELDASLHIVWSFASPTMDDNNPNGYEWCINAPAVDKDGTVYVNSEDGKAYAINPNGTLRDSIFLERALGAAYTPLALDHAGHLITLNAGHLYVIGKP
jgi:outer membrane protein assembly factor BamB